MYSSKTFEDIIGILLIDKPRGITSHDVVDFIRKQFKIKKAGHCGTLDPIATGLLVILLGDATKLASRYLNDDKKYFFERFQTYDWVDNDGYKNMGKWIEEAEKKAGR